MSEEKQADANVTVNFELTKEDLVNIKYADAERVLLEERNDLNKRLSEAEKAEDEVKTKLLRLLSQGSSTTFDSLEQTLKELGISAERKSNGSLHYVRQNYGSTGTSVRLSNGEVMTVSEGEDVYYVKEEHSIRWSGQGGDIKGEASQRILRRPTDEEASAKTDADDKLRKIREIEDEILENKRKIAELPTLVRQARAKMARFAIERTPQGREFLEALKDVDGHLLE